MREPVAALAVSRVRQELRRASSGASTGRGTGTLTETLFQQAAAAVLDSGSKAFWEEVLLPENLDGRLLSQRLYQSVIGPGLVRYQSSLQGSGEEAMGLWRATQAYAGWFGGLVETAMKTGQLRFDPIREEWQGGASLFEADVPLRVTLKQPGWDGAVVLSGSCDALIRAGGRYCIVEFQQGAANAEADLLQACLYREMLPAGASIVLVRVDPYGGVEELLVNAQQAEQARPAVLALIKSLAFEEAARSAVPVRWPKPAGSDEVELGKRLTAAFDANGAEVKLAGEPMVGPAFVRYFVEAGRRTAAKKVFEQGMNLQMQLKLAAEPMIHLSDGRIAVDVQRSLREPIPFAHVRDMLRVQGSPSRLLVGVDLAGRPHFADFACPEHAHLLVAGVAGSGKTEWLRSAIASLIVQNSRDSLRLVLIDPARDAFPELRMSPYLWRPSAYLCPPQEDVVAMLASLVQEMEERYLRFEMERVESLGEYLRKGGRPMPRIVCVCDEFGDLLMGNKRVRQEVENAVARLGQRARAVGIHLILATQRPSRQVVSGVLKANLPCRVALQVTEALESRIVMEQRGAENLLGRGDLLFSGGGDAVRLQAPLLDEEDRRSVFAFGRATMGAG